MNISDLKKLDARWNNAKDNFRLLVLARIHFAADIGLHNFSASEPRETSVAFQFAFHDYEVRLEANEDFDPIVVCRRKRERCDALEVAVVTCRTSVTELTERAGDSRRNMVNPDHDLFLFLTGLHDKTFKP
jgi:hypothetical protein